jgi:hypothetical protein
MPSGNNARIQLEDGGANKSKEHYETVTYWYGAPAPSLVKSDEVAIGDPASEKRHAYRSPDASPVHEITSRYEWGVDTSQGEVVYPPHTDRGQPPKPPQSLRSRSMPTTLAFCCGASSTLRSPISAAKSS